MSGNGVQFSLRFWLSNLVCSSLTARIVKTTGGQMASRVRAAVSRRLSAVLLLCATSAFAPGAAAATCPELEAALTAQGQAQFDEQHVNVLY